MILNCSGLEAAAPGDCPSLAAGDSELPHAASSVASRLVAHTAWSTLNDLQEVVFFIVVSPLLLSD
ncbi:hypothetical protein D3C76_1600420 [compost metagenome]